ncbi:unnamed protein product [Hydatigera taeniaeformis]|uniref:Myb-like domain-containing protein n=1 Tax=Hydatigena taeniaeformis TaxID=6205 RepID=A0A0R3X2Z9_HYDTA|nr:unnamed protein product [Hydatigera taeniaeformis]
MGPSTTTHNVRRRRALENDRKRRDILGSQECKDQESQIGKIKSDAILSRSNIEHIPPLVESSMMTKGDAVLPIDQVLANQVERSELGQALTVSTPLNTVNSIILKQPLSNEICEPARLRKRTSNQTRNALSIDINVAPLLPFTPQESIDLSVCMYEKSVNPPATLKLTLLPKDIDTLRVIQQKQGSSSKHFSKHQDTLKPKVRCRSKGQVSQLSKAQGVITNTTQNTVPLCLRLNLDSTSRNPQPMKNLKSSHPAETGGKSLCPRTSNLHFDGDKFAENDFVLLQQQSNSSAGCASNKSQNCESSGGHNSINRTSQNRRVGTCKTHGGRGNKYCVHGHSLPPTHQASTYLSQNSRGGSLSDLKAVHDARTTTVRIVPTSGAFSGENLVGCTHMNRTDVDVIDECKVDGESSSGPCGGSQQSYVSQAGSNTDDLSLQVFLDADYGPDTIPVIISKKSNIRSSLASHERRQCRGKSVPSETHRSVGSKHLERRLCSGLNTSENSVKKTVKGPPVISVYKGNSNGASSKCVQGSDFQLTNTRTHSSSCMVGQSKRWLSELIDEVAQELVDSVVDTAFRKIDAETSPSRSIRFESTPDAGTEHRNSKTMRFILDRGTHKKPIKFNLTLCLVDDANQKHCFSPVFPKDYHILRTGTSYLAPTEEGRGMLKSLKSFASETTEDVAEVLVDDALYSAVDFISMDPSRLTEMRNIELQEAPVGAKIRSLVASINGEEKPVSMDKSGAYNLSIDKDMLNGLMTLQLGFSVLSDSEEKKSDSSQHTQSHFVTPECSVKSEHSFDSSCGCHTLKDGITRSQTAERPGILIQLRENPITPAKSSQKVKEACNTAKPLVRKGCDMTEFCKNLCQEQAPCVFPYNAIEKVSTHYSECCSFISSFGFDDIAKNANFSGHLERGSSGNVSEGPNLSFSMSGINEQPQEERRTTVLQDQHPCTVTMAPSVSRLDVPIKPPEAYASNDTVEANTFDPRESMEAPTTRCLETFSKANAPSTCKYSQISPQCESTRGSKFDDSRVRTTPVGEIPAVSMPSCLKFVQTGMTLPVNEEVASCYQMDGDEVCLCKNRETTDGGNASAMERTPTSSNPHSAQMLEKKSSEETFSIRLNIRLPKGCGKVVSHATADPKPFVNLSEQGLPISYANVSNSVALTEPPTSGIVDHRRWTRAASSIVMLTALNHFLSSRF